MGTNKSKVKEKEMKVDWYRQGHIYVESYGRNKSEAIKKLRKKCVKKGHPVPEWDEKENLYICGTVKTRIFTFQNWEKEKNPVWYRDRGAGVVAYVYFQ